MLRRHGFHGEHMSASHYPAIFSAIGSICSCKPAGPPIHARNAGDTPRCVLVVPTTPYSPCLYQAPFSKLARMEAEGICSSLANKFQMRSCSSVSTCWVLSKDLTLVDIFSRRYIDRPISTTMSWPPQSAEVKKNLRKYLLKKKIGDVYEVPKYDIQVADNARLEGLYCYVDSTKRRRSRTPVRKDEDPPISKDTLVASQRSTGRTTPAPSVGTTRTDAQDARGPPEGAPPEEPKPTRHVYRHAKRKQLSFLYDIADKKWMFVERLHRNRYVKRALLQTSCSREIVFCRLGPRRGGGGA